MTTAAPVDPLTVPCPYCGVPSGERCVVQGGRYGVDYPLPPYARRPHTARTRLALERGSERFSQLRGEEGAADGAAFSLPVGAGTRRRAAG